MPFLQQTLPDGSPHPAAMYVNCLLCSALYHNDKAAWDAYAALSGSRRTGFESDPDSYQPDFGVLVDGVNALVVFDGTTNIPQWLSHLASAFFSLVDSSNLNSAVGTFLLGLALIENDVLDAMGSSVGNNVIMSGHSYGAGAAKIFCDHLAERPGPKPVIQLMTFGEPKSTGNVGGQLPTYQHNRIVACINDESVLESGNGIDPVTVCPPGALQLLKWNPTTVVPLVLLGFKWQHFGQAWGLGIDFLKVMSYFNRGIVKFDLTGWIGIIDNIPYAYLHLMDQSYLLKTNLAWKVSGLNPELSALDHFFNTYTANPFTPHSNLGPPVAAEVINSAFKLPTGTITEPNRSEFATISASATISFSSFGAFMATAPIIQPSLKGTLFEDIAGGGISQSFYSVQPPASAPSFQQMMQKMLTLAAFRTTLSQCADIPSNQCPNPLTFPAIRIDDTTVKRRTLLNTNLNIATTSPYKPGFRPTTLIGLDAYANDEQDAAFKVTFNDGFGNTAILYFHGVPLSSQLVPGAPSGQLPGFGSRTPPIDPFWLSNLNTFCNQIIALGLGLRYTTVQWTVMGAPFGVPPNQIAASGNGTPTAFPAATPPVPAVTYNYPGTPNNTYTFALNTPVAPILGKFRVIMREFKSLAVLNGRWPAYGFMMNGVYFVNVRTRAAQYNWDGAGYLSPEIWSVMVPAPAGPLAVGISGVSAVELTTHKVGRPFGLQRGRARNRVR